MELDPWKNCNDVRKTFALLSPQMYTLTTQEKTVPITFVGPVDWCSEKRLP